MIISRKYVCNFCGARLTVEADEERFARLDAGEHIQDVFPELSAGNREIMISGICGECFDKIFADDEDEDEDEEECSKNEPTV